MEVLARLDKTTGLRVFCGWPTCRGELARVAILESGERVLCMPAGSKQIARGHYDLNQHSAKRGASVTAAVRRGDLPVDQLAARRRSRTRRPIPEGKDTYLAAYGIAGEVVIAPVPKVGILADCPLPSCGRVNLLLAANLGVAAE